MLLILRMQPSEIRRLSMDEYWIWVDVCHKEINRRIELADRLNGQ